MREVVRTLASFFGLGYIPVIPGTWGSLAGFALAWYFPSDAPLILLVLTLVGFAISAPAAKAFGTSDPQKFVLDEVCGMMLSVVWLPQDPLYWWIAFGLFRTLDALKPWPISLIQKSHKPAAIMWDDLAAGAIVNFALRIAVAVLSH